MKLKQNIILIWLIIILILPFFVFAAPSNQPIDRLNRVGVRAGYDIADEYSAVQIAGKVVNVFFSILGIIFLFYILLAGYNYMTAQGNETKTKDALTTIKNCVIGLIIIISAWAIYSFVWEKLTGF